MENAKHFDRRIADWNSVLKQLGRFRFFRTGNFDLHISKREGKEFQISVEEHANDVNTPKGENGSKYAVGLHDLYW